MGQYRRKLKKGYRWFYSGQLEGRKYHSRAIYLTKKECKEAERKKLDGIERNIKKPKQKITFFELCNYRMDFLKTKSQNYYNDNRLFLRKVVPLWSDLELSRITRKKVNDYFMGEAARLRKEKKTNAQLNRELRQIKALFNYAISLDFIEDNPADKIKPFPISEELPYIPPAEELNRVFNALLPHQQWLVLFCMESACRINEALKVASDDIDLDKSLLTLWSRKKKHGNMKARRIPLSPIIAELKGKPGEKIFGYSDRPRFLWRTCKKMKIKPFGFHSFRHLKASEMASNNVPLIEIMNFLGHDNIEVTQKYLRLLGWTQY